MLNSNLKTLVSNMSTLGSNEILGRMSGVPGFGYPLDQLPYLTSVPRSIYLNKSRTSLPR